MFDRGLGVYQKSHCDGCGKQINDYRQNRKWLCKDCQKLENEGNPLPSDTPKQSPSIDALRSKLLGK